MNLNEPPAVNESRPPDPDHRPWPWWPPARLAPEPPAPASDASYGRRVDAGALDLSHGVVLYLEDISVSFDGFKALDNLSLSIDAACCSRFEGDLPSPRKRRQVRAPLARRAAARASVPCRVPRRHLHFFARKAEVAPVRRGDLIAVLQSGAYGLTASPVGFLGHPMPAEVLVDAGEARRIRERGTFAQPLAPLP